ncbi:hypothetical protein BS47DRAFT_1384624 [Hydnum rufescens UP504]|uniref:Cytochrome P450 n=1 Tax=Hydnum rufescens UP504 TaxID=1448309 RepID=A0A9P6AN49_9AGAM|nr:hypothetical protein BS47DRAFT_1384624 [Hydnum rufescens UP504]
MGLLLRGYAILLVLGAIAFTVLRSLMKARRYPPGPPGIPILGNLHKLENDFRHKYIEDISKTHGDVIFFYNPTISVLVLTSYRSMQDLLVNRGSIYSDRPGSSIFDMMGTRNLGTEAFGPSWKLQRKLFHQHMNKGALPQYFPTVEQESRRCLRRLHRNPDNWMDELRLDTTRVILGVTYDIWDVDSAEDKRVTAANNFVKHILSTLAPVRHVPSWMPWLGDEIRLISSWGKEDRSAIVRLFNHVKIQKNSGTARRSFVLSLLEGGATDERTMAWLASSMYVGGADTIFVVLHAFVLAMVLYPEAQRKAQHEIERVVGNDRLPSIQDRVRLPYVENLIKEVIRWWSLAPLGVPHRLMEDDEYRGYFIPKDTIVLPGVWCVARDQDMYPDPETFRPERFDEVSPNGQLPLDPHKFSFSMGRRMCPGQDFADMVLFSTISVFLATTTLSKSLDAQENEITPSTIPASPTEQYPPSFKCRVEVRPAATFLVDDNQIE